MILLIAFGRASLKDGMRGHDVAALQIALVHGGFPIKVDGWFGIGTESALIDWQGSKGLKADGIAGPATQEKFIRAQSARFGRGLPRLLLPSLALAECGWVLGARSPHPSDDGFDLGPFQQSFGPQGVAVTQANLWNALSIPFMAKDTAAKIKGRHDVYLRWGRVSDRDCWRFAVLYHNWPAAADRLAAGLSIFIDAHRDTTAAQWVIDASGGRLSTPAQWVQSYIEKATALVRW